MQEIAFQFEFLIVMYTVQNVGSYFKKLLDKFLVRDIFRIFEDKVEHLGISLEGFLLEFFIGVYLITFGLQNPTQSFWVHVVYIILVQFKRIDLTFEDPIVVNF